MPGLGVHLPCCTRTIRAGVRCGNGPRTGDALATGDGGEHPDATPDGPCTSGADGASVDDAVAGWCGRACGSTGGTRIVIHDRAGQAPATAGPPCRPAR